MGSSFLSYRAKLAFSHHFLPLLSRFLALFPDSFLFFQQAVAKELSIRAFVLFLSRSRFHQLSYEASSLPSSQPGITWPLKAGGGGRRLPVRGRVCRRRHLRMRLCVVQKPAYVCVYVYTRRPTCVYMHTLPCVHVCTPGGPHVCTCMYVRMPMYAKTWFPNRCTNGSPEALFLPHPPRVKLPVKIKPCLLGSKEGGCVWVKGKKPCQMVLVSSWSTTLWDAPLGRGGRILKSIKWTKQDGEETYQVHGLEDSTQRGCQFPLESIYMFNTVPINTPAGFLVGIDKLILNCVWKSKGTRIARTTLKTKKKIGRITLLDFRTYYSMTVWYWWKDRPINQWNRIESPHIDPSKYGQSFSWRRYRAIQWQKDSLFYKWCWSNWTSVAKKKTQKTKKHINFNVNLTLYENEFKMDHRSKCTV